MVLKDSGPRFGAVSIVNHWIIAVLIIAMLAIGTYMEDLPRGPELTWWVNLHKSIGIFVLIYGAWRVLWRLVSRFPDDVAAMARWQEIASKAVHYALLLAILGMPITGYMLSSMGGHAVSFFGLFNMPALPENKAIAEAAKEVHGVLSNILIGLIVIHLLAAVKHHVIDKDATLKRMLGRAS